MGGGGLMPTASLVLNRKVIENLPEWYIKAPVGDYYLQILGSLYGGALYYNETMAVYRVNLKGSWTDRMDNLDFRLNFYLQHLKTLDQAENNLKFHKKEFRTIKRNFFRNVLRDRLIGIKIRKEIFRQRFEILKFRDKLLWYLIYQNLFVHNFLVTCNKHLISPISRFLFHSW